VLVEAIGFDEDCVSGSNPRGGGEIAALQILEPAANGI
jgi:hypothetical protein